MEYFALTGSDEMLYALGDCGDSIAAMELAKDCLEDEVLAVVPVYRAMQWAAVITNRVREVYDGTHE